MDEGRNRGRKWLRIAGVGLLLVAVLAVLVWQFLPDVLPWTEQEAAAATGETATAFIGTLSASATASGEVEAVREASLSLATSGRVEAVAVEEGDVVEAGDLLVLLETDDLERAVAQAEQTLAIQEANLATLLAGPTATDLAAAEAAVNSAQTRLDGVLAGPSEEEIAAAEANVRAAQASVAAASNRLGETQSAGTPGEILEAQNAVADAEQAVIDAERAHQRLLDCEQLENGEWVCETGDIPFVGQETEEEQVRLAELRVVQARENLAAVQDRLEQLRNADPNAVGVSQANVAAAAARRDAAQANLDLLLAGPTAADIADARAALADARANLSALQTGPTAAQIASAEAQVEQARISLERAQKDLDDAALRAPFAGTVTAVYVSEGEMGSGTAVDLVDRDGLEVVLDVDEVDIGELEVGQPAVVTLAAWPDQEIESEIVAIGPSANSLVLDNTVAVYPVHLSLAASDLPVRVGMTADARLLTSRREDVLLVPNRAVQADREEGTYTVTVVESGPDGEEVTREVEVTVGLRDDRYTQIISGLEAGDVVRIGAFVRPDNPFEEDGPPQGGPRENENGPFGMTPAGERGLG